MKKLLSITLAVVLVLALGSLAFAAEGSLNPEEKLEVEIPVYANIGPYAKVWVTKNIEFGVLVGKVGIYTVNGEGFYYIAKGIFGEAPYAGNQEGWGTFLVETNTDVEIAMSFDETGWLASKTVFGVHKGPGWSNHLAFAASPGVDLGSEPTVLTHAYQVGEVQYDINGAIWIESISQQQAGDYQGTLTVTVSK